MLEYHNHCATCRLWKTRDQEVDAEMVHEPRHADERVVGAGRGGSAPRQNVVDPKRIERKVRVAVFVESARIEQRKENAPTADASPRMRGAVSARPPYERQKGVVNSVGAGRAALRVWLRPNANFRASARPESSAR